MQALALIGEFNNWDPKAEHWAIKNDFGVFQLFLPDNADGTPAIQHRCASCLASLALVGWLARVACPTRRGARSPSSTGVACVDWQPNMCRAGAPHRTPVLLPRSCRHAMLLPNPRGCRTKVKVRLETAYGEWVERIPAWIRWATQVRLLITMAR